MQSSALESASQTPQKLSARVLRTFDQIQAIRPYWNQWQGHRDVDFDVYRTVLESAPVCAVPYVIVVETEDSPVALLVGFISKTKLETKLGYFTISAPEVRLIQLVYGGFIGNQSPDNAEIAVTELMVSLREREADIAALNYLRPGSSIYKAVRHIIPGVMRDLCPTVQSHWEMSMPDRPEAIYSRLSGEHRWKLKRDKKRLSAAYPNLVIKRFKERNDLDLLVNTADRIAAKTYQRGLGAGFSKSRQIIDLLRLEAQNGWLRASVLFANGEPCAFWIGTLYHGTFISDYLGYDPAYSKYSPGNYLMMDVIEDLCREGATTIDFGIGDAMYKQRLATSGWEENAVYLFAPRLRALEVKCARISATYLKRGLKCVMQDSGSLGRIKKLWRKKLARQATRSY